MKRRGKRSLAIIVFEEVVFNQRISVRKTAVLISGIALLSSAFGPARFGLASFSAEIAEMKDRPGITSTQITIASCVPLSGKLKLRGEAVLNGGKAYFDYINKHGGVNGRTINVITCDDKYDREEASKCFYSCLMKDVFLGTLFQGTVPATQYVPRAEDAGIPMVGFSTGADFIVNPTHKYIFQLRGTYSSEGSFQVSTLWHRLKKRRIAIVYWDDAFGAACREGAVKELTKLGAKPVVEIPMSRSSNDVTPTIADLKSAAPDAIVLGVSADQLVGLVRKRKDLGENVQLVAFSSGSDLLTKELGKDADGVLVSQVMPLVDENFPTLKLYRDLMRSAQIDTSYSGLEGFLIALTVTEGLKRAGRDLTRQSFCKAMESIHHQDIGLGPNFTLTFTPADHGGFHSKVVMTKVANGQIKSFD